MTDYTAFVVKKELGICKAFYKILFLPVFEQILYAESKGSKVERTYKNSDLSIVIFPTSSILISEGSQP